MKYHSGKAWKEKYILIFKNIRKIDLIEKEGREEQPVIEKEQLYFKALHVF